MYVFAAYAATQEYDGEPSARSTRFCSSRCPRAYTHHIHPHTPTHANTLSKTPSHTHTLNPSERAREEWLKIYADD